ncbi:hypothetical protein CTAYLR_009705 [Chrysophaeum taylorii]|uniref:ATP-grasp domain-containing protein n=1 Tax=Chrysophaeum taylorii TaxID=2483200 RepID=A0AAD7U785_9STRA|nr:hypothetical protein CTAYLR_009705 [Chrysophaeum taylorii]
MMTPPPTGIVVRFPERPKKLEAWAKEHGAVSLSRAAETLVVFEASRGLENIQSIAAKSNTRCTVSLLEPVREFQPLISRRSNTDGKVDTIVIVDPLSSGALLAAMAAERGLGLVRVLSKAFPEEFMRIVPTGCSGTLEWLATLEFDDQSPEATARAISDLEFAHVAGVAVGCESGVECYDMLTELLEGFPSNGSAQSLTRRDKYPMGEAVRAAGLRACEQKLCATWDQAETFIDGWCVLKPCKSAGTDGVYIAKNHEEARRRFNQILGQENIFGETNDAVLVQEFLRGTEFVVDSVSIEGVHKCTAIWVYDKRPCNGAQFVYHSMSLFQTPSGEREEKLVAYVHAVLDALGVRYGPSHAEVMWQHDGPCLVEVGCRPHGGEGTFVGMIEKVIGKGFDQLSVMLDAIEKPYRFHRLPKRPPTFQGGAIEVCLIAYEQGTLRGLPGLQSVRHLASFHAEEIKVAIGDDITKTVDFLSTPGSIMLVHNDADQLHRDVDFIHHISKPGNGLYDISPKLRLRSL